MISSRPLIRQVSRYLLTLLKTTLSQPNCHSLLQILMSLEQKRANIQDLINILSAHRIKPSYLRTTGEGVGGQRHESASLWLDYYLIPTPAELPQPFTLRLNQTPAKAMVALQMQYHTHFPYEQRRVQSCPQVCKAAQLILLASGVVLNKHIRTPTINNQAMPN